MVNVCCDSPPDPIYSIRFFHADTKSSQEHFKSSFIVWRSADAQRADRKLQDGGEQVSAGRLSFTALKEEAQGPRVKPRDTGTGAARHWEQVQNSPGLFPSPFREQLPVKQA